MKENLKSDVKTLNQLDWPTLTLYEIVNNIDLDESIISLISLKFLHCITHDVYHYIYRNHELTEERKIRGVKNLTYNGNWSYQNGGIRFLHGKMSSNKMERKTLREMNENNRRY